MTRPWPPREPVPALWRLFCLEWLQLPSSLTAQWWEALQRAHWSRPVALRSIIVCRAALSTGQGSTHHFVTTNVSPAVLIDSLEDLIKEQRLPPVVARQIEEAVLRKTHRSGMWV